MNIFLFLLLDFYFMQLCMFVLYVCETYISSFPCIVVGGCAQMGAGPLYRRFNHTGKPSRYSKQLCNLISYFFNVNLNNLCR